MNLENAIERIVDALGFTGNEKQEVINDLISAIVTNFISEFSQVSNSDDVNLENLNAALKSEDKEEVINALNSIITPENQQILEKATTETISSWVDSVAGSIEDNQKQRAMEMLNSLKA